MKKSRITKLALSGAAVAALAATFSTSTYAWYVSNKTATVSQATGSTASAAADGSITLSWTGADDTWFSSLNWADAGTQASAFNNALFPVHYVDGSGLRVGQFYNPLGEWAAGTHYVKSGNTFVQATNEQNVEANVGNLYVQTVDSEAPTSQYVTFSIWIKSSSANTTVKPTVHFANTTANLDAKAQVAWSATGGVEKDASFVVDALRSMYYMVTIDESGDGNDTTTKFGQPAASEYATSSTSASAAYLANPGDAHTYYETNSGAGVGYKSVDSEVLDSTNAFGNFTVGTTKTKLTFTIWIDGADADCYNSCAEQTFSFDLVFKA